jgi:hypothetical protein
MHISKELLKIVTLCPDRALHGLMTGNTILLNGGFISKSSSVIRCHFHEKFVFKKLKICILFFFSILNAMIGL